jgi:hypothetical protein
MTRMRLRKAWAGMAPRMSDPQYLFDQYPELLAGCMYEAPPGWTHGIDQALADVHQWLTEHDDLLEGWPHFVQIKEKFGSARLYLSPLACVSEDRQEASALFFELEDLIGRHEQAIGQTCQTCGARPSELCTRHGWLSTLCPACKSKDPEMTYVSESPDSQ